MGWDYVREETSIEQKTGKLRCVIVKVETSVSSKGNDMIVVTVRPSGSKAQVKNYIVKNEYFNKNMTSFYDAFPEIKEGTFNFPEWVGCLGAADFGTDEKGYLKVKWWIAASKAEKLPEFEGDKPEKQTVTSLDEPKYEDVTDDSDMPF